MSAPSKRPTQCTAKCKSYRASKQREKNRDSRTASIKRGLSGLPGGLRRSHEYNKRHPLGVA